MLTRQRMFEVDLGPIEGVDGLGPHSLEEDQAFGDFDEPMYIDVRPSNGIHCMDDNVVEPGIQVPGGILETSIVNRYMDRRSRALKLNKMYKRVTARIVRSDAKALWVHGLLCAAAKYKRDALWATAENPSDALEFTGTVMDAMRIDMPERSIDEAYYTGGERADNGRLWNIDTHSGIAIARRNPNVRYEEFPREHIVAGLRIDTTENRFNNALFREEHRVHGKQVGALSITLGAFYKYLLERSSEEEAALDSMRTTLFAFGLAKAKAHNFLRAGIVVPRSGGEDV